MKPLLVSACHLSFYLGLSMFETQSTVFGSFGGLGNMVMFLLIMNYVATLIVSGGIGYVDSLEPFLIIRLAPLGPSAVPRRHH
jgi:hypothetical protein